MHMKWLQELQYQRSTSVTTASCPINSKASLRLPNVAFRRSINTISLMAFSTTPAPKLTCGFPVRTKVLQLPGSFATAVTLFPAKWRTLNTWLKGHRSMEMVSLDWSRISGQRGPVRPHPAAPAWPTFRTPRRASEDLAPGWTVESRTRLRTVVQAKGISTCTPSGCRVRTSGESRSWQTPPLCLRGPRVRSLTMRPSLPRRHPLSGWPTPASPTSPALSRISTHQTRPCLTDPAPSTPSALPRISAHQTRPCLGDGDILARWHWPRLPSRRWLLYLWDRALPDTWPWTSLPTGPWRGCGAAGDAPIPCCSPRRPTNPRRLCRPGRGSATPSAFRSPDAASHRGPDGQGIGSTRRSSRTSGLQAQILENLTTFRFLLRCQGTMWQIWRLFEHFFIPKKQLFVAALLCSILGRPGTFCNRLFAPKSLGLFFWLIFVALPEGPPTHTRKVVQIPLQFCFLYSQTSEHHLERFLLGAPFSFSFIHSISNAWDLFLRSRFYSTRQFQKLEGLKMTGNETGVPCFRFQVEMFWHKMWQYQCAPKKQTSCQ